MKDIEETLKSINFARMSRIKDKMLADFLAQRRRERIYRMLVATTIIIIFIFI